MAPDPRIHPVAPRPPDPRITRCPRGPEPAHHPVPPRNPAPPWAHARTTARVKCIPQSVRPSNLGRVRYHRRSVRLTTHDYSGGGLYSVTICAARRRHLFGRVEDGETRLTPVGRILEEEWLRIPILRPRAWLDAFVVMPDHFHGIVGLMPRHGLMADPVVQAPAGRLYHPGDGSLASVIGGFKSACTRRYRELVRDSEAVLWHRSFYEHWIRGRRQLYRARRYIMDNPRRWGG